MKLVWALVVVSVLGYSCASGSGEADPKHEWHELMEELEGFQYDTLKKAASDPGSANLSMIAETAKQVADELRKTGGPAMPGDAMFAQLASEAAQWYDDVATAAGGGPAAFGTTLSRWSSVERDVCKKCHDNYQSKW